jgi:hypothetical protein
MASGQPVVQVIKVLQPATLFAPMDVRLGGSTPVERNIMWKFDASTIWYLDFLCMLVGYGGGGITMQYKWAAATATTGVTRWGGGFRRIQDDAEDMDASHTYDYNDVDATTASAAGEFDYVDLTFTDGADMDSVANGEAFIYRVRRNASHANDNMTGNAELYLLTGKET